MNVLSAAESFPWRHLCGFVGSGFQAANGLLHAESVTDVGVLGLGGIPGTGSFISHLV